MADVVIAEDELILIVDIGGNSVMKEALVSPVEPGDLVEVETELFLKAIEIDDGFLSLESTSEFIGYIERNIDNSGWEYAPWIS